LEWMWSSTAANRRARKQSVATLCKSIRCQDAQHEGTQSGTRCVGSTVPGARTGKKQQEGAQQNLFESIRCQDAPQEGTQSGTRCVGSTVPGARTASSQGAVIMCHSTHTHFHQKKRRQGMERGACVHSKQSVEETPRLVLCDAEPTRRASARLPGALRYSDDETTTTTTVCGPPPPVAVGRFPSQVCAALCRERHTHFPGSRRAS
jgi:hypothetical protein